MAEENEEQVTEEQEESTEKGGGKKTLIIIVAIVVLALSASVGGTLFMLGFFDSSDEEVVEEETAVEEVEEKRPAAIYFPIKPAFVVNFPSRGKQRYLQVDVTILTRDIAIFDAMQKHMPLIKNRLNMLMSSETYEDLQTEEGKELMRQRSLQALQEIMQTEMGKDGVEEVLFTNFVMQ